MTMFLHVTAFEHLEGFRLRLFLNSGNDLVVDLTNELDGEIFAPLRDPAFFAQVRLNEETGTIEWPNGADFAPEFLAQLGLQQASGEAVMA